MSVPAPVDEAERTTRWITRALFTLWLLAVWLALWGGISVANVLSGLAVAAVVQALARPRGLGGGISVRPAAALYFAGYFLFKLVEASLVVALEIITPRDRTHTAIVAVPLRGTSDGLVTLVANAVSLTPGTLTIEVGRQPTTLYVHVLHLRDVETVRRDIRHLERLALRAFGSPGDQPADDDGGATPSAGPA